MPKPGDKRIMVTWDGLRCNHPPHKLPEDTQSSDLSRYPPPMMQGLEGAISKALSDIGHMASGPTVAWTHQNPSEGHFYTKSG